jgi:hypothetical protein
MQQDAFFGDLDHGSGRIPVVRVLSGFLGGPFFFQILLWRLLDRLFLAFFLFGHERMGEVIRLTIVCSIPASDVLQGRWELLQESHVEEGGMLSASCTFILSKKDDVALRICAIQLRIADIPSQIKDFYEGEIPDSITYKKPK